MKTLMKQITVALAVIALSTTSFAFASSKSATSYKRPTKPVAVKKAPATKVAPKTAYKAPTKAKRVVKVEYDYYPFQDCSRYITVGFNGYKCIDRD